MLQAIHPEYWQDLPPNALLIICYFKRIMHRVSLSLTKRAIEYNNTRTMWPFMIDRGGKTYIIPEEATNPGYVTL